MDWPTVVIGGVVGAGFAYFLPYAIAFPGFLWNLRTRDPIEGMWHSYHISWSQSDPNLPSKQVLRHNLWSIRRAFKGGYSVAVEAEGNYRGTLVKERGHLVVQARGVNRYTATLFLRLKEPVPIENDEIMRGMWLSFDFDQRITAGPIILSRDVLGEGDANAKLNSVVKDAPPDYLVP
jgi:hypothetical protein